MKNTALSEQQSAAGAQINRKGWNEFHLCTANVIQGKDKLSIITAPNWFQVSLWAKNNTFNIAYEVLLMQGNAVIVSVQN